MPATRTQQRDALAEALCAVLTSPNVPDSNMEPSTLIDVGDKIAHALVCGVFGDGRNKAHIELHAESITEAAESITTGLFAVASAIRELKPQSE